MKNVPEEIQMSAHLIVPTHFWLVGNGLGYVLIIGLRVLDANISVGKTAHIDPSATNGTHEVVLQNIGKHLYIISPGTISLGNGGIHVAVSEPIGETKLRE